MILTEKISANEKDEVLCTFSPSSISVTSGFLGGVMVALMSIMVIEGISSLQWIQMERRVEVTVGLPVILGLIGAMAAELLRWEYKINRDAYKRVTFIELHIPLVYPFFFLCFLGASLAGWLRGVPEKPSGPLFWLMILALVFGSAMSGSVLGVIWRFWYRLWLSVLSRVDWRATIDARNFNRRLKISFAEAKRYSSPLSLTAIDINQLERLSTRVVRKIQGELINIIAKSIREADVVGRMGGGKVLVALAHTGKAGAVTQAKRVKEVVEGHLTSMRGKKMRVTLNIGIASYTPEMGSHEDLIKKAQLALCRAKEEGGNRISVE